MWEVLVVLNKKLPLIATAFVVPCLFLFLGGLIRLGFLCLKLGAGLIVLGLQLGAEAFFLFLAFIPLQFIVFKNLFVVYLGISIFEVAPFR